MTKPVLNLEKLPKLFWAVKSYIWEKDSQHTINEYNQQYLIDKQEKLYKKLKQAFEECAE